MTIWVLCGNDDDGNDDVTLYKTKERAIEALNDLADELMMTTYEEDDVEYRDEDAFRFDNGSNHWTECWIKEGRVIE